MINSVVIQGRVVKDCLLLETKNGKPYTEGTLALNEYYKQGNGWNERVHYIDFAMYGLLVERFIKRLTKGTLATVQGKLCYRTWQSDDRREAKVYVVANTITTHDRYAQDEEEKEVFYEDLKSGNI